MELKDIKTGDLGATPPSSWWEERICAIIKARTFHWFMFIGRDANGWITTESKSKGTTISRFVYPGAFIYRMKELHYEPTPETIISIHADNGDLPYDWEVAFRTAVWWLAKHYLGKVLPVIHDKPVNCVEWVTLLAYELGVKIVPDNEYPMPQNLEHSPHLEYMGAVIQ